MNDGFDDELGLSLEDWEAEEAYYRKLAQQGQEEALRSPRRRGYAPWQSFSRFACEHLPRCLLKSEHDGWEVWAGARADCSHYLGHFDLILNLTGDTAFCGHSIPIKELARWMKSSPPPEILLDWPDMDAVNLPWEFWKELVQYLTSHRTRMLVFCVGGHGRTGTAIACLMVAGGWERNNAIRWIRKNYCPAAIESKAQEDYILAVETGCLEAAKQVRRPPRSKPARAAS